LSNNSAVFLCMLNKCWQDKNSLGISSCYAQ
jgi:hypothetical protein